VRKLFIASLATALLAVPAAAGAAPPGAYTSSSESAHAYVDGESEESFFFAGLEAGRWEFSEGGFEESWSGVSFFYETYTEIGSVFCYANDESDVSLDRQLTGLDVATTLTGECVLFEDGGEEEPPAGEPIEGEEASLEHEDGEGHGDEVIVPIVVTVDAVWTGVGSLSRSSWNGRGDDYVCKGSSTSRDATIVATVEIAADGLDLPAIDFTDAYAGMDRWVDSCLAKGSPGPA
jgi:hypothetical protein